MQITRGGKSERQGERMTPADALVPFPVSVICYLHLYAFFSFNKRRPGFSVTFMDSLFKKKMMPSPQMYATKKKYLYISEPAFPLHWAKPASTVASKQPLSGTREVREGSAAQWEGAEGWIFYLLAGAELWATQVTLRSQRDQHHWQQG